MGKTALATNIAFHIASPDNKIIPKPVLFFSLEMSSILHLQKFYLKDLT